MQQISVLSKTKEGGQTDLYNNFHKHDMMSSIFGMPDSATSQREFVERCVNLGQKNYFTTNHGNMGDIFEAKNLCNEYGVRCLSGLEGYIVPNPLEKDKSNYHIIIIPLTDKARKKLNIVNSRANIEGYYYKPRIFPEDLLKLPKEEFILTTACEGGLLRDDVSINNIFLPLAKHFGENMYLEIQNHNIDSQRQINEKCIYYKKKFGLKLIAANDSHYIDGIGKEKRNELLKGKHINYGNEDTYTLDYPDYETMFNRFKKQGLLTDSDIEIAINNTLIFDKCEEIQVDKEIKMPNIHKNLTPKERVELLKRDANIEFAKIKEKEHISKENLPKYINGMKEEMQVIEETNDEIHTADYFLFNKEMVNLAVNKYHGVLTRGGRGSCGGFYLNRVFGMTQLDRFITPLPLYYERFMSTARLLENRALPDIDYNVKEQEPFVKATRELLGEHGCYPMIAYGTMQLSEAFRNICRSKELDYEEFNEVAKNIESYRNNEKWKPIIDEAEKYVGVVVSASVHPCAHILSDKDLLEEYGVVKIGENICVMVTSGEADDFKVLKNDYLIVKVWKLISETFDLIGIPIMDAKELLDSIENDKRVWDLFANGITCTLNQVDSDWGTQLAMKYKISSFREAAMIAAAIRPSFDSWREQFLTRQPYKTGVKQLDDVFEDTDGYILFQENLMQYFEFLGVTPAVSIGLIKKISKKKIHQEDFDNLETSIKKVWIEKIGSENGFKENWDMIQACIKYGFCTAHGAAVGLDMCYGAYLKVNHTYEYYTVCFNNYQDDEVRTCKLTKELDYFGIGLSDVEFRKSSAKYSFDKNDKTIYKGMASIKYMNEIASNELYTMKDRKFDSFVELLMTIKEETSLNSHQLDLLIRINFFSEFGNIGKLLKLNDIFNNIYDKTKKCFKKQMSKDKVENNGLTHEAIKTYCHKETDKTYSQVDFYGLIKDIEANVPFNDISDFEKASYQQTILKYVDIINKQYKGIAVVSSVDTKYSPKVNCYALANGNTLECKISKKTFNIKPLEEGDVIEISDTMTKPRQTKNEDGKWVDVPDTKVLWIISYKVIFRQDKEK